MAIEIKVPGLPESVSDATIAAWHKQVGDAVAEGESLLDLETDKIMLEVPAPSAGVLTAITEAEGAVVVADQILGSLDPTAEPQAVTTEEPAPAPEKPTASSEPAIDNSGHSPTVRKLLHEHDLS